MANNYEWVFVSVFPNLVHPPTVQTKYAAVVAANDERVVAIRNEFKSVDLLLDSFINTRSQVVSPAILLVKKEVYSNQNFISAITAFRNIVALTWILNNWINVLNSGAHYNISSTLYSDYFDLFPLGNYGDFHYSLGSPSQTAHIDARASLKYQSNYSLPSTNGFIWYRDENLFQALIEIWEKAFVRGSADHSCSALLRSLQMAYSACKMPTDNLSSVFDYGTKVGLWISAFEILFHPGDREIHYRDVILEPDKYPLTDRRIKDRKFMLNQNLEASILGCIYKDIYDKRNDFFHGNHIGENDLRIFNHGELPFVMHVAPVLFLIALDVFLSTSGVAIQWKTKTLDMSISDHIVRRATEEPFVKIASWLPVRAAE